MKLLLMVFTAVTVLFLYKMNVFKLILLLETLNFFFFMTFILFNNSFIVVSFLFVSVMLTFSVMVFTLFISSNSKDFFIVILKLIMIKNMNNC